MKKVEHSVLLKFLITLRITFFAQTHHLQTAKDVLSFGIYYHSGCLKSYELKFTREDNSFEKIEQIVERISEQNFENDCLETHLKEVTEEVDRQNLVIESEANYEQITDQTCQELNNQNNIASEIDKNLESLIINKNSAIKKIVDSISHRIDSGEIFTLSSV